MAADEQAAKRAHNRRKNYIGGVIILAVIVGATAMANRGCYAAGRAQSRVRPGMSVAEVLAASPGWWSCGGSAKTDGAGDGPYFQVIASSDSYAFSVNSQPRRSLASEAELVAAIAAAIGPHPFHMWFSYMGVRRAGFGVDFGADGRVISKTEVSLSD